MIKQSKSGMGVVARIAVVAMAFAATLPAWGQAQVTREGSSWVETTSGALPQARSLRVNADMGSVRIVTAGQGFRYTVRKRSTSSSSEQEARRQFDSIRVSAMKEGDAAALRLSASQRHMNGRFNVDIEIQVPRDMDSVSIQTMAGNVAVQQTSAKLQLKTLGGNIAVDQTGELHSDTLGGNTTVGDVRGDAFIHSGGGNIGLGNVLGHLELNTAGGNVTADTIGNGTIQTAGGCVTLTRSNGPLVVRTAGGSIVTGEIYGTARLETGGGNIRIGMAKGAVVANTGGGNIEMWKLYGGAQAQSGAGAITAEFLGGRGSFADSYLHTSAGDVVVYLAGGVPATIRASSELASGRGIQSDFSELHITTEGGDYGPKTMFAEGMLNGGGPMLKVRTTIGQIAFRRSK